MSAIELDNPLLLQWHNAAAVFNDPVPTHIGLAVLTHQLGYFDILPLYVVLMLMAPFFAADRPAARRNWLLPAVARALSHGARLPPDAADLAGVGHLVLQPAGLAGGVRARLRDGQADDGVGALVRRHIVPMRLSALPVVILGVLVVGSTGGRTRPRCRTQAVLHRRQDLRDADPADPVPVAGRGVLDRLSAISAGWRSCPICAAGHGADRHLGHARAQLALRVLRRLAVEPDGADRALLLSRHCRRRHRRGNFRHRHHGVHRMACRIATTSRGLRPRRSAPRARSLLLA